MRIPWPLWPVFFLSGAAGLTYQVVWTRHAGLVLGGSIASIGTVVATFLLGLAAGAALGGRWIDRRLASRPPSHALTVYAALEIGIGLYALAFGPLLDALTPALGGLYRGGGEQGVAFNLARILLCALLVLPPTLAMGATLPILSRYTAAFGGGTRAIGLLYGLNTLGAVAGSAAAGWILIPAAGTAAATYACAALNAAIASAAFSMRRFAPPDAVPAPAPEKPPEPPPTWIFPAYACAGFAALVLEITWTRAFILSFGSSVHAFSLVLSCFILGVGLGSTLMSRAAERIAHPGAAFAALQAGVGLWTLTTWNWPLSSLPLEMTRVFSNVTTYGDLAATQFAFAAAIIVPPTALMGACWPVLCRLAVGSASGAGEGVGRLYAWNTAGNILGAAAASFIILPAAGLHGAVVIAGALAFFAAGAAAWSTLPAGLRWHAAVPLGAAAAVLFATPRWDPIVATAGPAFYGRTHSEQSDLRDMKIEDVIRQDGDILFERWDSYGLVSVHGLYRDNSGRHQVLTLRVNGKADASTGDDMMTQALTAHLPLLLHPDPREVLVIGLASGATVGSALRHPIDRVECVEISPAVVEAYKLHFHDRVGRPIDDRRCAPLIVGDARTHMIHTDRTYDVISSEPSTLWLSGTAFLHTRDHLARCRARLRPGGIFCQFVHAYRLPRPDFESVLATFRSVFPNFLIFEVLVARDYLLVGLTGDADYATLAKRCEIPHVKRHLKALGMPAPDALLRLLIGDATIAERMAGGARLITDDDTHVEYSSPRGLVEDGSVDTLEALAPLRALPVGTLRGAPDLAPGRAARAGMAEALRLMKRDQLLAALGALNACGAACEGDPAWPQARDDISRKAYFAAQQARRENRLADAVTLCAQIPAKSVAGRAAQQMFEELRRRP